MAWNYIPPLDRVAGVGLIVAATAGLLVGVDVAIVEFRRRLGVAAAQPKTQYITQETEDSLSLDTLNSLLDHYNYSIRETAAKIVCDRAINDDATLGRLLRGIARPDYTERMTSLRALAMLTDQTTMHRLNTREAFEAFVRSLEHCIRDDEARSGGRGYDMLDDVSFDEYYLRDIAEKLCLMFLSQLTSKFGVELAVRAGFVERWLAKQRWGGPGDEFASGKITEKDGDKDGDKDASKGADKDADKNADRNTDKDTNAPKRTLPSRRTLTKRIENFARYMQCRDNRIADICRRLVDSPTGLAALKRAWLVAPRERPVLRRKRMPDSTMLVASQVQAGSSQDEDGAARNQFAPSTSSPLRLELHVVNGTVVSGELIEGGTAALPEAALRSARAVLGVLEGEEGVDGVDGGDEYEDDNDDDTDGGMPASATARQRRPSQSTQEERRIRRQHREAMVLNDGTRPVRQADIIEREGRNGGGDGGGGGGRDFYELP